MIKVSCQNVSLPFRHPWKRGIAVGRAYDVLRADLLSHLEWLQREVGFETCRFHAIFHDDVGAVGRRADGKLAFRWSQVDKIYHSLLRCGLRPFVELNPMPTALASGRQTMFHYRMNVTPPRDWGEWEGLVRAFAVHLVEEFGLQEVRRWNFEVWNEPNLAPFWAGTREDYFRLYAHAARALKAVDEGLRVGGPATSKAHWISEFLGFCAEQRVPVDFVSTHLYPQDEFVEYASREQSPHAPGMFFQEVVRRTADIVRASAFPHLPLHWSEWNPQLATCAEDVSWVANRYVDSLEGASFLVRNMLALDDAAESFTFWVASDIFEEGPMPLTPFSHTYGLLTVDGLPKATANALRLLARLRGPRLEAATEAPPFCGAAATLEGQAIHVLAWNDALPKDSRAHAWRGTLQADVGANAPAKWLATFTALRAGFGSPFEAWEAMGCPAELTPSQAAMLRARAEPAVEFRGLECRGGRVATEFSLAPNEVLHIELAPAAPAFDPAAAPASEAIQQLDRQLGELSR